MSEEKVILVVEDQAPIRNILAHHLRTAGYKVLEAESGALALKTLETDHVDLIYLDVMMPKLDGFSVLEHVRKSEKTAKTPVIMCTAKAAQDDVLRARKLGANDYVVKPFTKAVLVEKAKKLIGEPTPVTQPKKPEKPDSGSRPEPPNPPSTP